MSERTQARFAWAKQMSERAEASREARLAGIEQLETGLIRAAASASMGIPSAAPKPPGAPGKGMAWQEAMKAGEAHCGRNPFPGVKALAKIVGCSPSTMSKAIRHSAKLRARLAEREAQRQSISAGAMTEGIMANAPQAREGDPLDGATAAELRVKCETIDSDPLLRRLMAEANEDERKTYLETPIDELRKLAATAYDDPEAHTLDQSPRVRGPRR